MFKGGEERKVQICNLLLVATMFTWEEKVFSLDYTGQDQGGLGRARRLSAGTKHAKGLFG